MEWSLKMNRIGLRQLAQILTVFCFCAIALSASLANPKIVLKSLEGAKVSPLEMKENRATVFIFITHDCPISNGYAPEIERIYREYTSKKISFFLVYVDPSMSAEVARKHRKEYAYTCSALLDPKHELVKLTGVTVTPEAAVISKEGKRLYRGRIDDRAQGFGKVRTQPNQRDLRLALDAIVAGKKVETSITPSVGCFIADLAK